MKYGRDKSISSSLRFVQFVGVSEPRKTWQFNVPSL